VTSNERLHSLDAVRGFALLAGVVLHATMSFLPGFAATGWPIVDNSTSVPLGVTFFVIHMFRMTTFFLIAGYFGHMLFHRLGTRAFVRNRSLRILVPLVVGWIVVFPAIAASFAWSLTKSGPPIVDPVTVPPAPALAFPLTHLWFLYVLVLTYAATLGGRSLFVGAVDPSASLRRGIDRIVAALMSARLLFLIAALPLAAALYTTPEWRAWFGIPTPDQSLIPNVGATVAFGTAFGLGWILQRDRNLLIQWRRDWWLYLGTALIMTVTCLSMIGLKPVFSAAPRDQATLIYAVCYALGTWAWTFGLIGLGLRFFDGDSRVRRYLADASYWIYIVHLPVLFVLQVAVRDLPIHWAVKFPAIMAVALALLFGSYHAFVRYSFIGEVLNGRRHRRSAAGDAPMATRPESDPGVLASLTGVRKRYGKVIALDGLSLDVRPGELLAVLGPNGAGKSTAISLMLGLHEADSGSALLFGLPPAQVEARFRVGVMMQEAALAAELRVREHIDLVCRYYPSPMTVDEAMALTHITALADRPYARLSGGQKRQVQFAIAICGRPALLFLDEPTVGLDVQAREMLWATLRQLVAQGSSIVLTTHYIEEAEALADRVAVVAGGKLVAMGTVNEMRALVARKRIRVLTAVDADAVRTWAGVTSVSRDGDHLQIVTADADAVVRRLFLADLQARDLEVQRAGLAEAFTELTQEVA
jgi:ABC-type multidrug transport system ATPase subunit/peptidoglycan/LPS O-acetylase OafA/YrhL